MVLKGTSSGSLLVVLKRGDRLVKSLSEVITKQNLNGGYITGVGALKDVELGYFEVEKKQYRHQTFMHENFELLALNGNIALKENKPFLHLHTVLGRSDFSTFGGHLFEATVAVTAEIYIQPLGKTPQRALDDTFGIFLICGEANA